ncbi:DddA-like double-stranded DNA deaminase toxin [Saccharothrix lopnurensis]|uniref:DddA-like double-stranded DNA deaminase toxin n=1 Tax=Saccharothrix lopnurensis TaxID=1670621 RepID=A0ABW1PGK8_9PSEU
MALTREVAAQVRAACAKGGQARAALEQAEDLAREAHDLLARALDGARHLGPDGEQVLAAFTGVVDACKGHYWPLLNEAVKAAQSYADHLATMGTPDPAPTAQRPTRPPTQPPPAQPPQRPPARQVEPDDPPVIPPERIEALRRELPPPVVPNTGQRTHGRWIGPDGTVQEITSGMDARSALVKQQLADKKIPRPTLRSGDVEMKLAADMAARGIKHATVVINHVTCKGR